MPGFITKSVTDAEGIAGIEISDPTTGVRAKVNADGQLSVDVGGLDINPGDINIGAIEIKDRTTDDRATVKTDGADIALTVRQNNQPLPTGAATEAKQDTTNTTLAAIATDTDNLAGIKAGTDKIIAEPATEAKQDTGNSFLDSIDGKLPAPVNSKVPVASTEVPSAALYDGSQATSVVAAALNGGTSQSIQEVLITNLDAAIGMLVGNATSQSTPLKAGASLLIPVDNLTKVFVKSASGIPNVAWLGRS